MGFFAVRRDSERIGLFDIWDIAGKTGDRIVFPEWGSVVAHEIELQGTTPKKDAAESSSTASESAGIQEANWRQSATPLPTIENSVGMRLVEIAPGESLMTAVRGGIVDVPVVSRVRITRPFLIGQTEVTVGEWQQVMGSTPGDVDQENLPVTHVSWHDAVAFCEILSSLPEEKGRGRRYRLPTNAEWEYACRAGTTTPIWFGDDHGLVEEYAWMRRNSAGRNHPVGLKPPNPWGLYDIRGNVHEWVSDWRADSWKPEPVDADGVVIDPQGPDHSPVGRRLVRGGSKLDNPDAFATETEPTNRSHNIGFRVVAVIEEAPSGSEAATPENQEVVPRNP
jgi:formylglycine-generating enzyme required for sulfatase activity